MAQTGTHFLITAERQPWVGAILPAIGRALATLAYVLPGSWVDWLGAASARVLVKYGVEIKVELR